MDIAIAVRVNRYGVVYNSHKLFCAPELCVSASGWVVAVLSHRAKLAASVPEHKRTVDLVWSALSEAARNAEWIASASVPIGQVEAADVTQALTALERSIDLSDCNDAQKFDRSHESRRWLLEHDLFPTSVDVAKLRRHFVSRFHRVPTKNRKLFSELPDGASAAPRYPLGALPHESLSDLKAQFQQTLDADLSRIVQGATKDLDNFAAQQSMLDRLAAVDCQEAQLEQLKLTIESCSKRAIKVTPRIVRLADPPTLLAAYISVVRNWTQRGEGPIRPTIYGAEKLCAMARSHGVTIPVNRAYQLLHPEVLTQAELLACALILQCASKWNFTTVLNLTTHGITPDGAGFIVRSWKGKTNQTSPDLLVSSKDHDVLRALHMLQSNLKSIKHLGWVDCGEKRLFFNTHLARSGKVRPYANWDYVLKQFIARHGLPRFTPEQVRVQALTAFHQANNSLDATQRIAGHANSITTVRYLEQSIMRAMNSSINLAYQRELERSVRFALDNNQAPTGRLFLALGDGSSCVNPKLPPRPDMLVDGACEANECHVGAGCPNRRIIIDHQALRDLTCTRRFYRRHWRSLLDENAEAFEKYHGPAILFAFGLREIVAKGPYRRYLAKVEQSFE